MRGKTLVGIIELQLNNQDIYKLLADYTGLGETGETVVTSLRNDRLLFMAPTRHDPDAAFRRQIPMKELPKYRSLSESSQGRASTGAEVVMDYSNKQVLAVWRFLPSFRWGMVTKVNLEEATASISAMRRDQLVIAFFAVLVVIAAALYVARSISNPISKLTQTTNLIAAGNLNEKIEIGSEDEVGELAVAFNKMTADLRSTLVSRDALAEQFRHRELLTDAIRHVVSQLGTTSTDIMNATGKLSHGAREQAGAVKQTAATVDQVSQTAVQAANRARKVADSVRRSEEVGKAGHKAVGDTIQVLGVAKERSDKVAENIVALAEKTQAIGEIIATVSEIAEQTNLLSLNAAIEAARAGEHGRGFTVVAQEVKALAEQSKKATGQVRSILESIQKAISTAVYSTEQGIHSMATATQAASQAGETIRLLSEIITEAAAVSNQIMQTASQQTAGMESVGMAISSINQVTTQNLSSTAQTENAARELNRMGQKLTDLLKESNPIGG
jgi:methyl-accepting chemotaxis protein